MPKRTLLWGILGATAGAVIVALAVFALTRGGDDSPALPPASLLTTPTPADESPPIGEVVPTLEPVPQIEIVDTTTELADDVLALNVAQGQLLRLVESGADVSSVEDAQRDVIARGISLGVKADLLADAVARQDGEVARRTAEMYQDVAKTAYVGAYALAIYSADHLASNQETTVRGLGVLWSMLHADDAGANTLLSRALGDEYRENDFAVTVQQTGDEPLPDTVVSVASGRFTFRLEEFEDDLASEAAAAAKLRAIADLGSPGSLEEMRQALAGRLVQYAEPPRGVSQEVPAATYGVDVPDHIVLSNGLEAETGRLFLTLADSDFSTHLFTFLREHLLPSQETHDEIVRQVIAQSVVDAFLDPDAGPDLGAIAALIGGSPPGPAQAPPRQLEFEEFLLDGLQYVPVFSISAVEVIERDTPDVRITISYEDITLPTKVWCVLGSGRFRVEEVEPGSGTVTLEWDDAFDLYDRRNPPGEDFSASSNYGCASFFGLFATGTVSYRQPDDGPAPTPTPGLDTPPGASIEDPTASIEDAAGSARLVVTVAYANPSDTALPVTCHFNGPAFSGPGGFNKETQEAGSGSGVLTFVFDLGGPAEAGGYDVTCVLNDDISRSTRIELAAEEWGIFSLERITEQTNSALGLVVARVNEIDGTTLCSFDGGGLDCTITVADMGGADLVLGPFASQDEAVQAFCDNIVPGSVGGYWYTIATMKFDGQEHPIHNGPACP